MNGQASVRNGFSKSDAAFRQRDGFDCLSKAPSTLCASFSVEDAHRLDLPNL